MQGTGWAPAASHAHYQANFPASWRLSAPHRPWYPTGIQRTQPPAGEEKASLSLETSLLPGRAQPQPGERGGEAGRRQGDSALGPEIICAGTASETQAYAKSHSMFLPACCPRFPMLPICFRCSWGRRGGRGLLSFGE